FTSCFSFVFRKLSKPFNDGFKPPLHSPNHRITRRDPHKTRALGRHTGDWNMARFDMLEAGIGSTAQAEILFELGMMYATGRDCDVDLVAAHKWFNIAAIKGSDRAAGLRAELAATMNKQDIARALRAARE